MHSRVLKSWTECDWAASYCFPVMIRCRSIVCSGYSTLCKFEPMNISTPPASPPKALSVLTACFGTFILCTCMFARMCHVVIDKCMWFCNDTLCRDEVGHQQIDTSCLHLLCQVWPPKGCMLCIHIAVMHIGTAWWCAQMGMYSGKKSLVLRRAPSQRRPQPAGFSLFHCFPWFHTLPQKMIHEWCSKAGRPVI